MMDASRHPFQADVQQARKTAILVFESFLASNQNTRKTYRSQLAKATTYPSEKTAVFCLLRREAQHVMFVEFLMGETLENLVRKIGRGQRWEVLPLVSRVVDGPQAKLEEAATNRKQLSSLVRSHVKGEGFEVVDIGAVSMPEQSGLKLCGGVVVADEFVLPDSILGGPAPDSKSPFFADAVRLFGMLTENEGRSDGWITALWRLPGYPVRSDAAAATAGAQPEPPARGPRAASMRSGQQADAALRPPLPARLKAPQQTSTEPEAQPAAAEQIKKPRKTRYRLPSQSRSWRVPYLIALAVTLLMACGVWVAYTRLPQ